MASLETVTRPLPHDLEAERAVLGSLILENRHLDLAQQQLGAASFYAQPHRVIFEAAAHLAGLAQPVDLVTLRSELERRGALEAAGGADYISSLTDGVPRTLNLPHYLTIVREKALLRELIQTSHDTVTACLREDDDAKSILDEAERKVFQLAEGFITPDYVRAGAIAEEVLRQTEAVAKHGAPTGTSTGFRDFDRLTGGLQGGELVIVAARPGMGKSTFCLNIAANVGCRDGKTVAVFSLEDSRLHLVRRLLCTTAKVNADRVTHGRNLAREDWEKLVAASLELQAAKIFVDDNPSTILEIKTKARRIQREHGSLDLIIVDYLQLIQAPSHSRFENRTLEIASYTQALKNIAKELHAPVIAASQLNRSIEQRPNPRPRLSDLRESGAIEQDADLVCFLFREDLYKKRKSGDDAMHEAGEEGEPPAASNITELIIAKHRNGPTGSVPLVFFPAQTRFQNADFVSDYPDAPRGGDSSVPF